MRESLVKNRTADNESAAGGVDKSVVNWLMHVISGKEPLGLGINDASSNEAAAAEAGSQNIAPRDDAKKAEPVQGQSLTAEDLCGTPVLPMIVGSKPVYEVVEDEPESNSAAEARKVEPEPEPEPEQNESGRFKQVFGLKVVGGAKSTQKESPAESKPLAKDLLREGAYDSLPATETSQAMVESLESMLTAPGSKPGELDPLELVRDPDYYEEKLRARETTTSDEVDFIPSQPEPVARAIETEPEHELMQVVYEAPVATAVPDPFAGVDFSTKPVEAELVESPVARALAIPDPFAGIDFSPEPVVAAEPVLPAVPAIPDPFAGIDFAVTPEPGIQVPEPEVMAAHEPAAVAFMPEPEAIAAPVEAEAEVIQAAPTTPAKPAVPDPFAGFEFASERAAEAEIPEPEAFVTATEDEPEPVVETVAPRLAEVVEFVRKTQEPAAIWEPEPAAAEVNEDVAEPEVAPATELAAPEVVTWEVADSAVNETHAAAEPAPEPVIEAPIEAQPEVVHEEVKAVPEIAAKAEEIAAATAEPATANHAIQREAASSEFNRVDEAAANASPWMAAAAQQNPNDIRFLAQDHNQQSIAAPPPAWTAGRVTPAANETVPVKESETKPEDLSAAIKTLMQLGSVLPLATRMAPGQERELGAESVPGGSQEVKQEVSGLRLLQYEIKTTVQDQAMHLRRLEDQLARIQESTEMDSAESASVMDNVKSTAKMIRLMGIGLGVMFLVLILLVGMILMHVK